LPRLDLCERDHELRQVSATCCPFNFHKVSKAGWKYIEDDVDRYCPDRELILKLYEEVDRLMHH
jgi:hypothetical protein